MRPVFALGLVFAIALVVGGGYHFQKQKSYAEERAECEKALHVYAQHLEDARRHYEPPRYVSCILELETLEGKRNEDYYKYHYRVEADRQSYELTCITGHGGIYPAYATGRGIFQGTAPPR